MEYLNIYTRYGVFPTRVFRAWYKTLQATASKACRESKSTKRFIRAAGG